MKHLILRNCRFDFDPGASPMIPAMALHVEECCRRGIIARYVRKLTLTDVHLSGYEGEPLETAEVEEIEEDGINAER